MAKNQVVEAIQQVLGEDCRDFLVGEFTFVDGECRLEARGGVYGVAIDLSKATKEEKRAIYEEGNKNGKVAFDKWQEIGNGFYPLYWGKDSNLGSRLFEHAKNSSSVYSLQLNKRTELFNQKVIYGAVLCANFKENEKKLRARFPDIYQNKIDPKNK